MLHRFLPLLFFYLFSCSLKAQQPYLLIDIQTQKSYPVKDSAAAVQFLDSLANHYYYRTQLQKVERQEGTTRLFFDKGQNFNTAEVELSANTATETRLLQKFYTKNLDSLKAAINEIYRKKGYSFSRVQTKFLGMTKNVPAVLLTAIPGRQRTIDALVIRGYDKLPSRFLKNLNREYRGKIYDDKKLAELNTNLRAHPFLFPEKSPQTLFTRDSTQIFLFLQKRKSNSFDGIIGFGNDKTEKFSFNGSLNLNLRNMFNRFETVNLFWQRNADRGQTFDLQTDIPYLFGSNVGTDIKVNIFRQDSTFATVKLLPAIYLHLNSRQKIGLRGRLETSTVTDSLYTQARDFTKKGVGIWYRFTAPTDIELFQFGTKIQAEADLLSTHYPAVERTFPQSSYLISAEHNLSLAGNHFLNLRAEGGLFSSAEILGNNELFRLGGWNSFRGFNENSLLADKYFFGSAEYRYLIGAQAFFDVFGQYGQLYNKSLQLHPKLYSFGVGFNFFLPIGLMSFQIANGTQFGNPIKFGDTKIHWGILTKF